MPPKVALLVPSLGSPGGVTRIAMSYYDILIRNGYEVECFSIDVSWKKKSAKENSEFVSNDYFGPIKILSSRFRFFEIARYWPTKNHTKELNTQDLVILISGTLAWNNWLRNLAIPSIHQVATLTRWERESRDSFSKFGLKIYKKTMTSIISFFEDNFEILSEVILVENTNMKNWLMTRTQALVLLLPPPIDCKKFFPASSWNSEGPLISVGRLDESRKGWSRLFYFYNEYCKKRENVPDLLIVGNGTLQAKEFEYLRSLEYAAKIKILNNVTDLELSDLLRKSSLFVTTSYEEGLGLAALEGLASALPIVATKTFGSLEYVIPDFNGFLVGQDPEELEKDFFLFIEQILKSKGDSMSKNSRRLVIEKYSLESIEQELLRVIVALLE